MVRVEVARLVRVEIVHGGLGGIARGFKAFLHRAVGASSFPLSLLLCLALSFVVEGPQSKSLKKGEQLLLKTTAEVIFAESSPETWRRKSLIP